MEITLKPETEALIRKKIADGRYESASEVVATAVFLLDEQDRRDYLRSLMLTAEQQTRDGKVLDWTPELRQGIRERAEFKAQQGIAPNLDVCP
mgnify:CR=1 FL=1